MPKYMVRYSGFAFVEADSEDEAKEDYESDSVYEEKQVDSVEEVEEFVVGW